MSEPRAFTEEELRDIILQHIRGLVKYWARLPAEMTLEERCDGVAFSILTMLDGATVGIPSIDLVFRPHPSDKAFHIEEGENWIEPGTTISDVLHERYCAMEKKK